MPGAIVPRTEVEYKHSKVFDNQAILSAGPKCSLMRASGIRRAQTSQKFVKPRIVPKRFECRVKLGSGYETFT